MQNNYSYSQKLLHHCLEHKTQFIYASSAAVYGGSKEFVEDPLFENPLNVYGYSKIQFDRYVRRVAPNPSSQVVGLRYFNVYGPHEQHKGSMASVAFHFNKQIKEGGVASLFAGTDGYGDGEQVRDFVFIDDIFLLLNPSLFLSFFVRYAVTLVFPFGIRSISNQSSLSVPLITSNLLMC